MNKAPLQNASINIRKYALLVMMICYAPHFMIVPWWLFAIILTATGYKLFADYQGYPTINRWIRFGLVIACLILLKIHYRNVVTSEFFIGFLLTFIALKTLEIQSIRDIRVLILCNLYLILSALILVQELWIIVYMLVAILSNLSLMLKINAPQASLMLIGKKSGSLLATAIPITIILFYVFPRLANPLWQVPSLAQSHTGFSERLNPGAISQLFNDDSIAMRITFKAQPMLAGYWKGLVLSFFNGSSWNPTWYNTSKFVTLPDISDKQGPDYEIILEPGINKWLFYLGYPNSSHPALLFSPAHGLQSQSKESMNQRFAYSLKTQSPPYQPLTPKDYLQNTQLPRYSNPQLIAWAKEQYANQHHDTQAFITFIHAYINQQPFWYTLTPPALNSDKNQMDQFWFNTQKGFCEHYTSAVAVILRSAGIPARVIVGYQGGEWNPIAHYLNIQQNDAHAWLEYWQEGIGWTLLDPTGFISTERIDPKIRELLNYRTQQNILFQTMGLSWLQRFKLFMDSAQFFAERWLLFYNQDAQQELLQITGFGPWNLGELLQASVGLIIVFIILIGILYEWRQKKKRDPIMVEYHLLQQEFRRHKVLTHPSATLKQQCQELISHSPILSTMINNFLNQYERLRLQQTTMLPKEKNTKTLHLFKALRKKLKKTDL